MIDKQQSLEGFIQSGQDLVTWPGAFTAQKKKMVLDVFFANKEGVIETLEGPVTCRSGDAILTGIKGEQWPVPKENFQVFYKPVEGGTLGVSGLYEKLPSKVIAVICDKELLVTLPNGVGELHAKLGDVTVQYAAGDYAVVDYDIFNQTYDILK